MDLERTQAILEAVCLPRVTNLDGAQFPCWRLRWYSKLFNVWFNEDHFRYFGGRPHCYFGSQWRYAGGDDMYRWRIEVFQNGDYPSFTFTKSTSEVLTWSQLEYVADTVAYQVAFELRKEKKHHLRNAKS